MSCNLKQDSKTIKDRYSKLANLGGHHDSHAHSDTHAVGRGEANICCDGNGKMEYAVFGERYIPNYDHNEVFTESESYDLLLQIWSGKEMPYTLIEVI